MDEFTEATRANPLDSCERVHGFGVAFQLRPFDCTVRLANIRAMVPGSGAGTKALTWLLALADKHNVTLVGEAEPTGHDARGLDATALASWYRRHGFRVSSRGDIEYAPEGE